MKKLLPGLSQAVIIRTRSRYRRPGNVGFDLIAGPAPLPTPSHAGVFWVLKSGILRHGFYLPITADPLITQICDRLDHEHLASPWGGWLFNEQIVTQLKDVVEF